MAPFKPRRSKRRENAKKAQNAKCTQGVWQKVDDDLPHRRKMITRIVMILQERKPNASPEWVRKLPQMARRLEDSLYREAGSLAEYCDFTTLKRRLQQLAMKLGRPAPPPPIFACKFCLISGDKEFCTRPGPHHEIQQRIVTDSSRNGHVLSFNMDCPRYRDGDDSDFEEK